MAEIQTFYILNKEMGETPLECMERFRQSQGLDPLLPMTYAGRLDPMAEGVLLVLVGEECKDKNKYLGLDKEYEVEVLFGFATDTYDILGKISSTCPTCGKKGIHMSDMWEHLQKFKGKFVQEYPAYSSKTVDGVQLHTLANEGNLPDEMPTKEVEIYDIEMLEEREIDSQTLLEGIKNKIAKVKGDFRQNEIIDLWEQNLQGSDSYKIVKIKVSCSSGTYMRSLAHNLGRKLGVPALAYSIKRNKIQNFSFS